MAEEEKTSSQGHEEGEREELEDSVQPSKSGSTSPTAEEKPRSPEQAPPSDASGGERGESAPVSAEAGEGKERSGDGEKKRRRKNEGGASDSSGKKRFNLREEMSEVKTVLEGEGEDRAKCNLLHRRYQSLVREYKRLERRLVECQKKQLEVAQHRDIIQNEYARANLARSKLENLCRELQKHSKQVAEESRQRAREEEERRKEVSGKFQTTINEITMKLQEHHQRNQALQQENMELASKLKQLAEQYDAREEQFEKIMQQRHLEVQLSEAKLARHTVVAAEEKELSLQERQQLLRESLEQQQRCEQLTRQEAELRGQLALYSEKFEEFQTTLTKSNEVFNTFKKEMDKMSKTISVLEKEMTMWKSKYEKCNKALIDTAEERLHHERQAHLIRVRNEKLEKLCRALQAERNQLQEQLRKVEMEKERGRETGSPDKQLSSNDHSNSLPPDVTPNSSPPPPTDSQREVGAPPPPTDRQREVGEGAKGEGESGEDEKRSLDKNV